MVGAFLKLAVHAGTYGTVGMSPVGTASRNVETACVVTTPSDD